MSYQFVLSIVGSKQGSFKGGSTRKGSGSSIVKSGLPCHGFEYQEVTQYDPASGQPTGKRQHTPYKITRESDAASPVFFQGVVTNVNLTTGVFGIGSSGSGTSSGGGAGGSTAGGHQVAVGGVRVLGSASPSLFQGGGTSSGSTPVIMGKGLPGLGSHKGSGSGSGSGKGHHGPIVITREVDSASPLLLQALVTNELLTTVQIKWGQEKNNGVGLWHVLELSNARIVGIRGEAIPGAKGPGERVEFDCEKLNSKVELS